MRKIIKIKQLAGEFAENKDVAKRVRINEIMPALAKGEEVIIDFNGVSGATQSFIHALVSDPIREYKEMSFDKLMYKNANDDIREIVSIVYRYMQESIYGENSDV
jgi:hypothetical protein